MAGGSQSGVGVSEEKKVGADKDISVIRVCAANRKWNAIVRRTLGEYVKASKRGALYKDILGAASNNNSLEKNTSKRREGTANSNKFLIASPTLNEKTALTKLAQTCIVNPIKLI